MRIARPALTALVALGVAVPGAGAVPVTDLGAWDGVGGFRPVAVAGPYVAGTKVIAVSPDEFGHAARWSAGALTDLGAIGGVGSNRSSGALDVNAAGLVVGVSNTADDFAGEHAFKASAAPLVDLGVFDETVFAPAATARGVNAQGYIVGNSVRDAGGSDRDQGFRLQDLGVIGLDDTFPAVDPASDVFLFALSDGGQSSAVGARGWDPVSQSGGTGFVVSGLGDVRALGFVPGRHGLSPDGRWAAGTTSSTLAQRVDVQAAGALAPTTLQALAPATTAVASAVNTAGVVVGSSGGKAVAWAGTVPADLNGLLDEGSDWVLQSALDIDDSGLVVGFGTKAGVRHGFLIQYEATAKITVTTNGDQADANQEPAGSRDAVCDVDRTKAGLQCTLRAAIQTANEATDKNEIVFDIPGGPLPTITPKSVLPAFTAPVSLDGRTQPGTPAGKPGVELDGRDAGLRSNGLRVQGGNSEIRGLIINRFSFPGISVKASGNVKIQANWIGLDRSGTGSTFVDAGNSSGVDVGASDVLIGGPLASDRNVISGNGNQDSARRFFEYQGIRNERFEDLFTQPSTLQDVERQLGAGIVIHRATAGNVRIEGNWIGINPDGTRPAALTLDQTTPPAFGNLFGILIGPAREGGPRTGSITIGGNTGSPGSGVGNVISGNVVGVLAIPFSRGFSIGALRIQGNRIGPDAQNRPLKDLSSVIGLQIAGDIASVDVVGNQIQNVGVGAVIATEKPIHFTGNEVGVDQSLEALVRDIEKNDGSPTLGLHNLLGFLIAGGSGLRIGGAGGDGNKVVGNVFQQGIAVVLPGGRIEGNTFGSKRQVSGTIAKSITKFTGLGGLLVLGKGGVISNNRFANTITGLSGFVTPDFLVERNTFDSTVIGLHGMLTPRSTFQGNTFTRNAIGTFMFGIWPTDEELKRAGVDPDEFGELAQKQLFTGLAADKVADVGRVGTPDAEVSADGKTYRAPLSPVTVKELLTSAKTTWYGNTWGSRTDASQANIFPFWALGDVQQMRFGSTAPGQGNVVARNLTGLWLGPAFAGHQPAGIELRGNAFLGSGKVGTDGKLVELFQPGVDLLPQLGEGVTDAAQYFGIDPNDVGDGDTGPNGMQNHPQLVGVEDAGTALRVRGVLPSKPGARYTVDVYANHACVGSGRTGGSSAEQWLGELVVSTDGFGNATIDGTVPKPSGWSGDLLISTMATSPPVDGFGETSEISDCVRLGDPVGNVIVNGAGEATPGPDVFIVNGNGARIAPGPGDTVIGTGDGAIVTQPGASPAPRAPGVAATVGAGVRVSLRGRNVRVALGGGNDQVSVQGAGARVASGGGNDGVRVVGAKAIVDGGAGGDSLTIVGASGVARGGPGNDLLRVTGARARGTGAAGNDSVIATGAAVLADGGAGNDVLIVKGVRGRAVGAGGNDRVTATGARIGVDAGAGKDAITVAGGGATVLAGAGNDTILAKNRRKDRLDGGAGKDSATVDRVDVRRRIERVRR